MRDYRTGEAARAADMVARLSRGAYARLEIAREFELQVVVAMSDGYAVNLGALKHRYFATGH